MTTTRTPEATTAREAQAKKDRRRKIIRSIIGRGGAYAVLIGFAIAMLFPFVFMVAAALKTPEDTFRYPPKILPRTAATAEVNGEAVDLYSVEVPGEGSATVYLADAGVEAGLFASLDDPETTMPGQPLSGTLQPIGRRQAIFKLT